LSFKVLLNNFFGVDVYQIYENAYCKTNFIGSEKKKWSDLPDNSPSMVDS